MRKMQLLLTSTAASTAAVAGLVAMPGTAIAANQTCNAPSNAHCLAIDNKSDSRILSFRLLVFNPNSLQYEKRDCLSTNSASGAGKWQFPNLYVAQGEQIVLNSYRDRRDCEGEMWAGQGYVVGDASRGNYTLFTFTNSNPDVP
jgi:hypothetical protein